MTQPQTDIRCQRQQAGPEQRVCLHAGFTILELLACIAVVAVLGIVCLPALGAARESARRLQCHDHLKQLGIALHAYHEVNRCLPPGWRWDEEQTTAFGWIPPLLSYLEDQSLMGQIDFNSPVSSEENTQVRNRTRPFFLCPSDLSEQTFILYAAPTTEETTADLALLRLPAANYVGVFGTIEPDEVWQYASGSGSFCGSVPVRFREMTRGLSNVLLVGERRTSTVPSTWLGIDSRGEEAHCRILGNANLGPNQINADECEFTSRHPGMANFLWGDGRVQSISNSIDSEVYQRLARRSDF